MRNLPAAIIWMTSTLLVRLQAQPVQESIQKLRHTHNILETPREGANQVMGTKFWP
jgi:hypothetical protein